MALIKCKDCGHEVSDDCETCPNCGADIQQQVYDALSDEEKKQIEVNRNNTLKWVDLGFAVFFLVSSIQDIIDAIEFRDLFGEGPDFFNTFMTIVFSIITIFMIFRTIKRFTRK